MSFPRVWVLAALLTLTTACGAPARPLAAPLPRSGAPLAAQRAPQGPPAGRPLPAPVKTSAYPVQVIAHRGYSRVAPENTLAAIEAAVAAGADAVEFDVRLSKDGQPVVIHDASVARTTDGRGEVAELTLAQLRALDAGAHKGAAFAGERIPTLEEALDAIRGRAMAYVEIKSKEPALAARVADAIQARGMAGAAIVISFYELPLSQIHARLPELPLGGLNPRPLSRLDPTLGVGGGISLSFYRAITRRAVEDAHAMGLRLNAWTVDDPEAMKTLAEIGVDGIITNEVEMLQGVLKTRFHGPIARPPLAPAT